MAFATIPSWSTTAGTNTELDGISLAENVMVPSAVNNAFREMMSQVAEFTRRGSDLATASTLDLDSIDTMFLDLTGTTTVTAVTLTDGHSRRARAQGAFQLTASSSLIVNGSTSSNYTTTAGDLLFFEGYGTGVVRVWAVGGSVAAATTSVAGIVELATAQEALAASSSALALTPASIASLIQNINNNAFEIADLKGTRLNMAGGIADAYDSETDVDTATSTNESYDSGNDLYSPTVTGGSTSYANTGGTGDRSASITVTSSGITPIAGSIGSAMVNGDTGTTAFALNNTATTGYIQFDLGSGVVGYIDEIKLYKQSVTITGAKLAGSNDGSTFTDLQTGITITGTTQSIAIAAHATAYRYFRLIFTGSTPSTSGASWYEIEFKIAATAPTIGNMTLVSNAFTASAVPTQARVAVFIDPQVSITINTDFTAEVSRDGGTTWTAVTLALVSNPVGTVEQYEGTVSISSQPSGTSMKYRLKTLNNKDIDVTGIVFQWS